MCVCVSVSVSVSVFSYVACVCTLMLSGASEEINTQAGTELNRKSGYRISEGRITQSKLRARSCSRERHRFASFLETKVGGKLRPERRLVVCRHGLCAGSLNISRCVKHVEDEGRGVKGTFRGEGGRCTPGTKAAKGRGRGPSLSVVL